MVGIKCDVCGDFFDRQSSLTRHKKNLHTNQPSHHECHICSKRFTRRDLLLRHERLHRGEGLSPCEICYRSFRADYLDKHVKGCRLRAWKPLSGSATIKTSLSADVANSNISVPHNLQWQPPTVGVAQRTALDSAEGTGRRVRQPHRYVILRDPQHFATDAELLEQAISVMENWDGSLAVLKAILEVWRARGHSLRRLDELSIATDGSTLIARACYDFTYDIAEYILTLDLDFDRRDNLGRTALHWLCRNGLTELVQKLLPTVKDINEPDAIGDSPLYLASRLGHTEIIKLLCVRGAQTNIRRQSNEKDSQAETLLCTPLEFAVSRQDHEAVRALIRAGASPNFRGELMPLETGMLKSDAKCCELLLEAGANVNLVDEYYIELLHNELKAYSAELMHHGSNVSSGECISILEAADKISFLGLYTKSSGFERRTKVPSKNRFAQTEASGIDVARDIFTPVLCPDRLKGSECSFWRDAQKNPYGHNPLMLAARAGAVDCVHHLLLSYRDLSWSDNAGMTALHHACKTGNYEIVQILLQRGAQVDYCSAAGSTSLCIAAFRGHNPVITLLLEAGAMINGDAAWSRSSPLYWACTQNYHSTVILLLEKGADVNHGTPHRVALEQALQHGSAALVSTLLAAGALTEHIHETCWIDLRMAAENERTDGWLEAAEKIRLLEAAFDRMDANEHN